MSITFETGALTIGYVGSVASWRRTPPSGRAGMRREPMLIISFCADIDEGVYTPATSIVINTVVGLRALRAAIDEALKYENEIESGVQGELK